MLTVIKREKRRKPPTNRKCFCWLCSDGIWRFSEELAEVSLITGKTNRQKRNIIRNRMQESGINHPNILGPVTRRGRSLSGGKIPRDNCGGAGKPNWGGLKGKDRSGNLNNIRNHAGGVI